MQLAQVAQNTSEHAYKLRDFSSPVDSLHRKIFSILNVINAQFISVVIPISASAFLNIFMVLLSPSLKYPDSA
jgi:hypothetical protein